MKRLLLAATILAAPKFSYAGNVPPKVIAEYTTWDDMRIHSFPPNDPYEDDIGEEVEIKFTKDFNDCLKISNDKHSSDLNRCDKNSGGKSCYDRADRTLNQNTAACERVAHSDNLKDSVSSGKADTSKK